jgi:excinuclease UvrABC ATPase subunit
MRQDQPMAYPDYGSITIRGARENNLKNVSLDIPKRRITVFTGVSGSGKSSLVFSHHRGRKPKADQRNLSGLRATIHAPLRPA